MVKKINIIKSLFCEYGLNWVFTRLLYTAKLKLLKGFPACWKLFEINCEIKTLNVFDFNITELSAFLKSLSQIEKDKIIKEADDAAAGKILTFRSGVLDYGQSINWFMNPITQYCIEPDTYWFKIPDFDDKMGDIKIVWEASRFLHFYAFARAYILSDDEKYAEAFWQQVEDWGVRNPYPMGVNWKCGQEASFRMISFLFSFAVFKNSPATTPEREQAGKNLVRDCYKKVRSNFFYAHRCIKNNHTISESAGWIIGAYACYDEHMVKKGFNLLDETILKQFKTDGGYIQHSFNYHRLALQVVQCILALEYKIGGRISQDAKIRVAAAVDLLYQCQDETGKVPNYGNNDGTLVFPVTCCEYLDYRPTLQALSLRLMDKRLYEKNVYDEEALWFSGQSSGASQSENKFRKSSVFYKSGYYTLRRANGFCMIRCVAYDTRPAHMDALHMDIWHKGKNIFCDGGSYSYALEEGRYFPDTAMHNTVTYGEREQMQKSSHFFVYDWINHEKSTHFDEEFIGEIKSKSGYTHNRKISVTDQGYFITDKITANRGERVKIHWHSPYKAEIDKDTNTATLKDLNGEILSTISVINTMNRCIAYLLDGPHSYYSQYYNIKTKGTHIVFETAIITAKFETEISFDVKLY